MVALFVTRSLVLTYKAISIIDIKLYNIPLTSDMTISYVVLMMSSIPVVLLMTFST